MTALIREFGPLGVFLLMVPEAACVPVPSEVTLLFSGFAVGQHWMGLTVAILAATAGNVVGSLIAYALGASRLLAAVPGGGALIARAERLLDGDGLRSVFTARLMPLARTFVSLPAGSRRVPLMPFVALTALGSAIWAAGLVLVGLLAGSAWAAVSSILGKAMLAFGAIALAALARKHHLGTGGKHYAVNSRRREDLMEDEKRSGQFHSRSADAAAARHGERHPDEDPEHPEPSHVPEPEDEVPNRHSASAEAASLRWRERHPDDDQV